MDMDERKNMDGKSVISRNDFSYWVYPLIAEFIGTFILVCVFLLHMNNPIAIGVAYASMLFCFGKISMGHFNPIFSLVLWWKEKINMNTFLLCVLVQVMAGYMAYTFIRYYQMQSTITMTRPISSSFPLMTSSPFQNNQVKESFPTSTSEGITPHYKPVIPASILLNPKIE